MMSQRVSGPGSFPIRFSTLSLRVASHILCWTCSLSAARWFFGSVSGLYLPWLLPHSVTAQLWAFPLGLCSAARSRIVPTDRAAEEFQVLREVRLWRCSRERAFRVDVRRSYTVVDNAHT